MVNTQPSGILEEGTIITARFSMRASQFSQQWIRYQRYIFVAGLYILPQNSNNADLFLRQICPFDVHQVYYRLNRNTEPLRSLLLRACQHLSSNWIDLQGCREMDLEIQQNYKEIELLWWMVLMRFILEFVIYFCFCDETIYCGCWLLKCQCLPFDRISPCWMLALETNQFKFCYIYVDSSV